MVKELKATLLVETLIPSGQQRYETASRWVCLPLLSSHSNQSPTLLPSWLLNENNFLSLLMDFSGLRPRLLQPHFPSRPTWTIPQLRWWSPPSLALSWQSTHCFSCFRMFCDQLAYLCSSVKNPFKCHPSSEVFLPGPTSSGIHCSHLGAHTPLHHTLQ